MVNNENNIEVTALEEQRDRLIDQYKRVRERDAESVKQGRLNLLLIEIGRTANKLKALKEDESEI